MRPTNLGFRSPKERTAEYTFPIVTHDGRALPFLQQNRRSSLSTSKRFAQYEVAARKTNITVGPGSYNIREEPLTHWNISGTPKIKPYCAIKDPSSNGYLFIGNHMVFDQNLDKRPRRSSLQTLANNEIKQYRLSSTSTPRREYLKHHDSLEKMKNSPYLAHRLKTNPIA